MGSVSKKTASRHTTTTEQGSHSFEIFGYSLNKGMGVGQFIRSGVFAVGGYDWAIRVYTNGLVDDYKDYVLICIEPMSKDSEAWACCDLSLVNQHTGLPVSIVSNLTPRLFKSKGTSAIGLILRSKLELEASGYILDDCLKIECVVTVIKGSQVCDCSTKYEIEVPESDLSDHFGKLLLEKEGADVTFCVGGETIAAHKIVLASRSRVFKAELYGQMKERTAPSVTIEDMHPDVFRTLLHFIYTDSLPADVDDLDGDDFGAMIRHLLVAADRYAMDRLKLMCQSILCERYVGVETVATTLAFADLHNCDRLKEVCMDFMASSDEMDAVVATPGFASLKKNCPSVLVDVLEKTSRLRKA